MGKNRGIIKKLMVLLGSVLLISAGITYFAVKRGDENYIMDVLSLVATLVGTIFIAVELKNSAKVTCCDMLIQLNNYFHDNSSIMEVYEALETEFTGNSSNTKKEWSEVRETDIACYCTFFENIYLLVRNKIAKMEDIDSLFAYRFFLFMNNARIQEKYILPTSASYSEIFELYEIWMRYRKRNGEEFITPNIENAFSDDFLKKKTYLREFDCSKASIDAFTSERGTDFSVKKGNMSDIGDILCLQNEIVEQLPDSKLYCPLTRTELIESLFLDSVYCVWQNDTLTAFSVLVTNRKNERNLYYQFKSEKCAAENVMTFDAVAVLPEYRGHSIQKILIDLAFQKALENKNVKYMAATVSPENTHSLKNFKSCGFKIFKENLSLYGNLNRTLLIKELF